MKSTTKNRSRATNHLQNVTAARRCHECSLEALGRCPDCHMSFCEQHFPKQQHSPCAEKQMKLAQLQICYICGAKVYPDQWSVSKTSHFVDEYMCHGCGHYICDDLHTQHKTEDVIVSREGLRGHRYQYIIRYCDVCSPLNRLGGIKGLAYAVTGVATVVAGIFFYLHP